MDKYYYYHKETGPSASTLMDRSIITCDRCKKRPAIVYRRLTRQRLCTQCHFDYLMRTARRNFGHLRNIPPRTPAFVPIVPWMVGESILLLKIVSRIEKKHGSNTWAVVFGEEGENTLSELCTRIKNGLQELVDGGIRVAIVTGKGLLEKIQTPGEPKVSRWRRLRAVAGEVARRMGGGLVVLPACMELLASIELSGYLRAVSHPLGEAKPALPSSMVTGFVNGFYGVPCAETTLHSMILTKDIDQGLLKLIGKTHSSCKQGMIDVVDETAVGIIYDTVSEQSYEVLFSMQKSSLALTRPTEVSSCRLCGGNSTGEVCTWCQGLTDVFDSISITSC